MIPENPSRLLAAAALLLGAGWATLFAMTVRWVPPNVGLSLAAYALAVAGLAVGLVGAGVLFRQRTRR